MGRTVAELLEMIKARHAGKTPARRQASQTRDKRDVSTAAGKRAVRHRVLRRGLPEGTKEGLTKEDAKEWERKGWQLGISRIGYYAMPPGSVIDRAAEAEANKLVSRSAGGGLDDLINRDPYGVALDLSLRDKGTYSVKPEPFLSSPPFRYTQPPSMDSPSSTFMNLFPQKSLSDRGLSYPPRYSTPLEAETAALEQVAAYRRNQELPGLLSSLIPAQRQEAPVFGIDDYISGRGQLGQTNQGQISQFGGNK